MEYKTITTAAGQVFSVPEHILRNDESQPAGWQLRYGEWTDYPDKSERAGGALRALEIAMTEMQRRIDTLGK
jgi:hypothetical protein